MAGMAAQWRDGWLTDAQSKVLSWKDLESQKVPDGPTDQDFWRAIPNRSGLFTDSDLENEGILRRFNKKLYHIAHIPWKFGRNMGKENWSDEDWALLARLIEWQCSHYGSVLNQFSWDRLTIRSASADKFIRYGIKNSHIIGLTDLGSIGEFNGSGNLFDGSVSGAFIEVKDAIILGSIATSRNIKVIGSKIQEINFNAARFEQTLEIERSYIGKIKIPYGASELMIRDSDIGDADFNGAEFSSIKISSSRDNTIYLSMSEARVKGRATFEGLNLLISDETNNTVHGSGFNHARFDDKIRIVGCNMRLSLLSDAKFDSQIDIDFDHKNIEDVFEDELASIFSDIKQKRVVGELKRKRLERACQIICERHRQDGRRDLEHRFRRMELKARAYRADADFSTRFITWCYSFFSDFGRSVTRPLRGLAIVMATFFFTYWYLASISLGLPLFVFGPLDCLVIQDAALMAVDKVFPFGASIDEAKLFYSEVVGEVGGFWGAAFGLLGAMQTVLSGIMVFLLGLAVRTKLLIG